MTDGLIGMAIVGFIAFLVIGILIGRHSVYEQIRDEHNLKAIEDQLKKRKNDILSLAEVRDIIEGSNEDV